MWSDTERLCLHASAGAQGKKNNTPEQARSAHLRRGSQQKVRVRRQKPSESDSVAWPGLLRQRLMFLFKGRKSAMK